MQRVQFTKEYSEIYPQYQPQIINRKLIDRIKEDYGMIVIDLGGRFHRAIIRKAPEPQMPFFRAIQSPEDPKTIYLW